MSRSALIGVRLVGVVLACTLASQFLQPQIAAAQPGLTLSKVACNLSTAAACGTAIAATPGQVVQYQLTVTNSGTTASNVTVNDAIAGLQGFNGTSLCMPACSYNSSTATVSFSLGSLGTGGVVTVIFSVTVLAGASGNLVNTGVVSATGTGNVSNTTTVTVSGVSSVSCLTVTKTLRDLNVGDAYTTNENAFAGDVVRYRIVVTNSCGFTVTAVTIGDVIPPGERVSLSSCALAGCVFNGSTVTFLIGVMPPGSTATVYLDVTIAAACGASFPNTATAGGTNTALATSNTTNLTVFCAAVPPVFVPPFAAVPFGATIQICGVLTVFTPAITGYGFMTINGINFSLMPGLIPGGIPFAPGGFACVTITFNQFGQVAAITIAPNVAAVNFVCGVVTPFTPGFMPYPGFNPYPGYTPNPSPAPYPGYGPYPIGGIYGFGGPVMVGGYPFPVAPGTYFPVAPVFGNSSCFVMNSIGYVNGSLSVVPTAATPVEEPAAVHYSGRALAL